MNLPNFAQMFTFYTKYFKQYTFRAIKEIKILNFDIFKRFLILPAQLEFRKTQLSYNALLHLPGIAPRYWCAKRPAVSRQERHLPPGNKTLARNNNEKGENGA